MAKVGLGGPMLESSQSESWQSIHKKHGAHYNVYGAVDEQNMAMKSLRKMFPHGEANELNLCLFSASGVHGTYTTIEEVEASVLNGNVDEDGYAPQYITFLIVQPRIVCLRYGNCYPKTQEDFAFLYKLRATSWAAFRKIGRHKETA